MLHMAYVMATKRAFGQCFRDKVQAVMLMEHGHSEYPMFGPEAHIAKVDW